MILQGRLERLDPLRIGARTDPPVEEIRARRELDVLVAELGDEARQLEQRHMSMHVGVERNLH